MKYKLLGEMKENGIETVLNNRGINTKDIPLYLNLNSSCENHYSLLFSDTQGLNFYHARYLLEWSKRNNITIYVIVDCDADGVSSASEIMNYLFDLYGEWVIDKVKYIVHEDKTHGIELDKLPLDEIFLLIVPDAGTNDIAQCKVLYDRNIPVIVLDHHNKDVENPYCVLINNKTCDYPNGEICGVAVVNKFLQYLDDCYKVNFSNKYNDLVSLGMISDMQSMAVLESKYLIERGLSEIRNPFLKEHLSSKDIKSKLKGCITPSFIAFYVSPYVNAMWRSGSLEERKIFFESFLSYRAYETVNSGKRGEKGDKVALVLEGIRIARNVKSRQDRNKKKSLEYLLKEKIPNENLDENSVMLILNEKEKINKNIAGLVCNELLSIYQRPVCCLTKVENDFIGSARGYDRCEINDFQSFCKESKIINWAKGHSNAFGLSIQNNQIEEFLKYCNQNIKHNEPVYYIDYIWENEPNKEIMEQIISLEKVWGTKMPEPLIYLKNVCITYFNINVYSKENNEGETVYTIKFKLFNSIELIRFNATKEEVELLPSFSKGEVSKIFDFVGYCSKNEFKGKKILQIRIEDFMISIPEEKEEKIILKW